jgi:hypothetical protein
LVYGYSTGIKVWGLGTGGVYENEDHY